MDSQAYWKQREEEQLKHNIIQEAEYQEQIKKIYDYMFDQIEKEINGFYTKYATKEGITLAEAKKRVSQLDIEEYERKAEKYVKNKTFTKEANEEMRLYNATMKINRLELLKANIGLELVDGFDDLQKYYEEILTDRTLEELERQAGILGESILDNAKAANSIVNASFHNATFSDRIWMYQDMLKAELSNLLIEGMIQGKNPRQLATHLQKRFGVSKRNAERLMRTELARVQIEAQKQSYEQNGYEEYQFHALGTACEICKELDGKRFKVKDMEIAVNAPPCHPNCRCSTSAYMDDDKYNMWLDSYKEHGLGFEEWIDQQNDVEKSDGRSIIKLSDDEQHALNQYLSFESYRINEKLRNGVTLDSAEKQMVDNLDSVLEKMPYYEGNLSRSLYFGDESAVKEYISTFVVGKPISFKEFISTTNMNSAYNPEGEVQIFIQNAKNGRDISQINKVESEVLYERNSGFKTVNIQQRNGIYYILLEEV